MEITRSDPILFHELGLNLPACGKTCVSLKRDFGKSLISSYTGASLLQQLPLRCKKQRIVSGLSAGIGIAGALKSCFRCSDTWESVTPTHPEMSTPRDLEREMQPCVQHFQRYADSITREKIRALIRSPRLSFQARSLSFQGQNFMACWIQRFMNIFTYRPSQLHKVSCYVYEQTQLTKICPLSRAGGEHVDQGTRELRFAKYAFRDKVRCPRNVLALHSQNNEQIRTRQSSICSCKPTHCHVFLRIGAHR